MSEIEQRSRWITPAAVLNVKLNVHVEHNLLLKLWQCHVYYLYGKYKIRNYIKLDFLDFNLRKYLYILLLKLSVLIFHVLYECMGDQYSPNTLPI